MRGAVTRTGPRALRALQILGLCAVAAAVGLLAVIHPLAPAAAVLGGWLVLLGVSSPFTALIGFMVVLYTRPGELLPALEPLHLAKVAALASLALFGLGRVVRRDLSWAVVPQNTWMLLLTAAVVASAWTGTDRATSMALVQETFVKIVVLYVLIVNLVDSPRRALVLQQAIALCATLLAGYAIHEVLAGRATIEGSRAGGVGLLGDPNDLALTILVPLPFLALAAIHDRRRRRWLYGLLAVVLLSGITATGSRGGLLGVAAAGYLVIHDRLQSRLVSWGVVIGVLAVLATSGTVSDRVGIGGGGVDASAQGRLDAWQAGLRMLRAHPVLGVGYEQFEPNYFDYVADPLEWTSRAAHSSWVQAAAETGLAGLIPLLALVWLSLRVARRLRRIPTTDGLERALLSAQLPGLVGFLVAASFLSQAWGWFIYILVAQIAAMDRVYGDEEPSDP